MSSDKPDQQKRDTAMMLAGEIKAADERADAQADKSADRLERSHKEALSVLRESMQSQIDGGKTRERLFAGLFALSLFINLALVAGLLRQNLNVTADGVTITQPGAKP